MWADRGPQDPQGHITGTPHRFLFTPCSLLPAPRSLLFATPHPHPRAESILRLSAPRPAGSSPGSDLTSASVLSGVD